MLQKWGPLAPYVDNIICMLHVIISDVLCIVTRFSISAEQAFLNWQLRRKLGAV